MFLSIDGTLVVQIVNFVVFIILLDLVFLRPVGRVIAERRAYIDGITQDIESGEAQIRTLRGQADEQRAAARREAEAAIAQTRARSQDEAAQVLAGYQERAAALIEEAQRSVAGELDAARAGEDQLVDGLARTMLERAIGPGAGV